MFKFAVWVSLVVKDIVFISFLFMHPVTLPYYSAIRVALWPSGGQLSSEARGLRFDLHLGYQVMSFSKSNNLHRVWVNTQKPVALLRNVSKVAS